jgi:hypothetical protein
LETALDEETRRHKETQTALRKKDRRIKEVQMAVDEEHKNFVMAQDTADRLNEKLNIYKRQLGEAVCLRWNVPQWLQLTAQESYTMQNLTRVRRYQHDLEEAEGRAEHAESSLNLIRAKHRSSVVTGKGQSPKVTTTTQPQQQQQQKQDSANIVKIVDDDNVTPLSHYIRRKHRSVSFGPPTMPILDKHSMTAHLLNIKDYIHTLYDN